MLNRPLSAPEIGPRLVGRVTDPICKATDIAYMRFAKTDLAAARTFFEDFGFVIAGATDTELYCRGTGPNPYALVAEKATDPGFLGIALAVPSHEDLEKLAALDGAAIEPLPGPGGGNYVRLTDPNGFSVDAVHGREAADPLPTRKAEPHNTPQKKVRINQGQRSPLLPAEIVRLGHLVIETPDFEGTLGWYMACFGFIPTDVLCLKDGTPAVAFNRCDRGDDPADHHTLVIATYPVRGCNHSAYEVQDLDSVGLGQQVLKQKGYTHAWGIGRHIHGSQIFDYWRDPDGDQFEHFADGDVFTSDVETGYHPLNTSGLYQWGADLPASFIRPHLSWKFFSETIRNLRTVPGWSFSKLRLMASSAGKARPWL